MNTVLDTIAKRSSIRKYQPQLPTKEEIDIIIQAGLQAPTARNLKELHFTVITTPEIMEEMNTELLKTRTSTLPYYYGAPLNIMISAVKDNVFREIDTGIAIENMCIAAQSIGLGSLIIGCSRNMMIHTPEGQAFQKKLGIPDTHEFVMAVAFGYPDTEKVPHSYSVAEQVNYYE